MLYIIGVDRHTTTSLGSMLCILKYVPLVINGAID